MASNHQSMVLVHASRPEGPPERLAADPSDSCNLVDFCFKTLNSVQSLMRVPDLL
jgi:hypothetical protein